MSPSTRARRRALPAVLAGLGLAVSGAACSEQVEGEPAAASTSEAAPTGEADSPEEDLAALLLPPEAFGPDAQVVTIDVRGLSTSGSGALPPGGTITPPECAESLGSTQPTTEDLGTVVAQSATTASGVTVEVLAEGGQVGDVAPRFDELLERCPQVTVDAPDGSSVTVRFSAFDVPDLGDASDGLALSTAVTAPGGAGLTVPGLLAVAVDGDRMVFLQQTGSDSAPLDEAAFTALFEEAVAAQQDD